eukprot:TRINITY_DN9348_c0_g1_i1.p3 TRINITY_DN9348_c0_g1~~TRINITY_DN9348_c0_g1_i1.p3  ORF type:complete len:103 (-),score=2.47 TRINITY_DN9348_c0_g1_i1:52-360(-)
MFDGHSSSCYDTWRTMTLHMLGGTWASGLHTIAPRGHRVLRPLTNCDIRRLLMLQHQAQCIEISAAKFLPAMFATNCIVAAAVLLVLSKLACVYFLAWACSF